MPEEDEPKDTTLQEFFPDAASYHTLAIYKGNIVGIKKFNYPKRTREISRATKKGNLHMKIKKLSLILNAFRNEKHARIDSSKC